MKKIYRNLISIRDLKEGVKIYRLTFIKKLDRYKSKGNILILCKCDCGNEVEVGARNFIRGERQKCGTCHDIIEVTKTEHYRRAEKNNRSLF